MARWTTNKIAGFRPSSSAYTDPNEIGLQVEVRTRNHKPPARTFYHRYLWKGDSVRMTLGHFPETTLEQARARTRENREHISKGIDPRRARPKRRSHNVTTLPTPTTTLKDEHSFEFLVAEFRKHKLSQRKKPEYAERILSTEILPVFGDQDIRTIKARDIVTLTDPIVERGSLVMANKVQSMLSQLFSFAVQRGLLETSPVLARYRPGGTEKPRERVLTDKELKTFLKDPKDCTRFERLATVIKILLLTGQRRGELTAAKWSDIDFRARTWRIPEKNAKNGRESVVPLSDWAVDEFKDLKREAEGSPMVLPAKKGSLDPRYLSQSMVNLRERFETRGIEEFTLHDLRRTCRTGLSKLKVAPHVAEAVLNHVQRGVAGVYDRYDYLPEKREALEKWEQHLRTLRA
jgi:integrase